MLLLRIIPSEEISVCPLHLQKKSTEIFEVVHHLQMSHHHYAWNVATICIYNDVYVVIGAHVYQVPVIQGISAWHVENAVLIQTPDFMKLFFCYW